MINIKNNDSKCFLWCHVRHLNLMSKSPNRIAKEDKKLVSSLNYEGIEFPVPIKDYCKIEKQHNICIKTTQKNTFVNVVCSVLVVKKS